MSRWVGVSVVSVLMAVIGPASASAQEAAPANGGIVIGLHRPSQRTRVQYSSHVTEALRGPVHTVNEETWDYQRRPGGEMTGSRYSVYKVYDGVCYLVEDSRNGADGTILMHTRITRDEYGRPLRTERNMGADPAQTRVNTYDNQGLATVTGYDGSGTQTDQTRMHTSAAGDTTFTRRTENEDGSISVAKSMETTDPATMTRHESIVKDGQSESERLTQLNAKGETQSEALLFGDGTSIRKETLPDGSVRSHFYNPPTKTNIYKTTDKQRRLTELVEDSPDGYTRTTYQYDDVGRQIASATFDRKGKPTGRTETNYQFDSFGNWTEQKTLSWNPKMGSKPPQVQTVVKRVIGYYTQN